MVKKNTETPRQDFQLNWTGVCSRWYIQGRGRNRFQAGACRGRCGGRRSRDRIFVFSKGLGEYILLTLSNSTSSIVASDPTNYAPFYCDFLNKTTQLPVQIFTSIQNSNLVGTRSRSEKLQVRESFPCSTSSSFHLLRLCAFYHWNRLTDWKAMRKGQLFCFWVVGGLGFELRFNWAQDDSLNLLSLGLDWAWLMI